MDEKKGFMVLTPVGGFKSPNSPKCREAQLTDEVARTAGAVLSPDAKGLKFVAVCHEAHYASCQFCQEANPTPNPEPTPQDMAEVEEYKVTLQNAMRDESTTSAVGSLLSELGLSREEALREIAKALAETGEVREKRIGFGN